MLIGYARVSTPDQSVRSQVQALKAAGCEKVFSDEGVSGAAVFKPEYEEALTFARRGDTLVVWKLDRLSRRTRDLIDEVQRIEDAGMNFRSLQDAIDTNTSVGKFFFHVMAAIAELERDGIRERTKAGLAAARRAGKRLGRPPSISDDQWDIIRPMISEQTHTIREISTLIGVSRQAIYRRLKKEELPSNADQSVTE